MVFISNLVFILSLCYPCIFLFSSNGIYGSSKRRKQGQNKDFSGLSSSSARIIHFDSDHHSKLSPSLRSLVEKDSLPD